MSKRKPLGWAKEKVGRQIVQREFLSKKEMKKAFADFIAASEERAKTMITPSFGRSIGKKASKESKSEVFTPTPPKESLVLSQKSNALSLTGSLNA
jgi:hypothetical protein